LQSKVLSFEHFETGRGIGTGGLGGGGAVREVEGEEEATGTGTPRMGIATAQIVRALRVILVILVTASFLAS